MPCVLDLLGQSLQYVFDRKLGRQRANFMPSIIVICIFSNEHSNWFMK
jgi:hypothetical protein